MKILVIGAGVSGIATARGLLRDGHDVTVFERSPRPRVAGGAVTIWSNGSHVLRQLDVDMSGAGQLLSQVQLRTASGHPLATIDVTRLSATLGAPTRMVPRRVLMERINAGFPTKRIRYGWRALRTTPNKGGGVRVEFADAPPVSGDLVIGADGLHSMVRAQAHPTPARPTGWCSWQGLLKLPDVADSAVAAIIIGAGGNLGMWPSGQRSMQWWFDLPWSANFVRPASPLATLRAHFTGWSPLSDHVLSVLTDDDLVPSPFPHFRHRVPRVWGSGPVTLVGDAAHTMPPTLAQGTNQALLDIMVLRAQLTQNTDPVAALRNYERLRRPKVAAMAWVTSRQVAHGEALLRPVTWLPKTTMTWALTRFLSYVSDGATRPPLDNSPRHVRDLPQSSGCRKADPGPRAKAE